MIEQTSHMDARLPANVRGIHGRQSLDAAAGGGLPARKASRFVSMSVAMGLLRLGDALGLVAAGTGLALWLPLKSVLSPLSVALFVGFTTILALNLMQIAGVYRHGRRPSTVASAAAGLGSWLLAIGVVVVSVLLAHRMSPRLRDWLELWFVCAASVVVLNRCVLWMLMRQWRRTGRLQREVAVLGGGPIGQRLMQKLLSARDPEVRIVGVYDDRRTRLPKLCFGHPIRGDVDDLVRSVRAGRVDCVFVALPLSADWRLAEIMNKLCLVPVDVKLCADNCGFHIGECEVSHVNGLTTLDVCNKPLQSWRGVAKTVEDKLLSAVFLAMAAPLMAVVALLIKLDSPGPVLFRQKRRGLNNQLIEVLKFRTLYDDARDPNAERLCGRNDPRVTRVGSFLRRTMIDELPQLINALRGEMSVVGPRPHALAAKAGGILYPEAVKYYDARHRMKPGITGWAQVNGWRGETRTVEEIGQRVEHDLYYIQHWSVLFDLAIVLRTILGVFVGFGPKRRAKREDHAVPVADPGRSRSAA
jgi:Undecaprenyl-phosphate glucose phosphotransferase